MTVASWSLCLSFAHTCNHSSVQTQPFVHYKHTEPHPWQNRGGWGGGGEGGGRHYYQGVQTKQSIVLYECFPITFEQGANWDEERLDARCSEVDALHIREARLRSHVLADAAAE